MLTDAGEAGSHYSEQEGWGLTGSADKASPDREAEAAAELFRASRAGSLAMAGSKAERRGIAANRRRLRAEFVSRRRRGENLVVRPAREIDAERESSRGSRWKDEQDLRRRAEQARRSGRIAYDTARAVYLGRLPTVSHRLLHLLRREGGAVAERGFVSRHARLAGAETTDPEVGLIAALRELTEAGKVRRLRSRETGEVFLTATEPLDEEGFRRSPNGLIRDPASGIANPWSESDGVESPRVLSTTGSRPKESPRTSSQRRPAVRFSSRGSPTRAPWRRSRPSPPEGRESGTVPSGPPARTERE